LSPATANNSIVSCPLGGYAVVEPMATACALGVLAEQATAVNTARKSVSGPYLCVKNAGNDWIFRTRVGKVRIPK
jgi:hypothetical protein